MMHRSGDTFFQVSMCLFVSDDDDDNDDAL